MIKIINDSKDEEWGPFLDRKYILYENHTRSYQQIYACRYIEYGTGEVYINNEWIDLSNKPKVSKLTNFINQIKLAAKNWFK